jgi:hypothetical protein
MKYEVLTNDTYERSEAYYDDVTDKSFLSGNFYERTSLNRFAKACKMVDDYDAEEDGNIIDYSFHILNSVAQGGLTQWSIVYDIKNMKIYFRTFDRPELKNLDMKIVDYSCKSPVMFVDINFPYGGNVNSVMLFYNYRANRRLIESSYDSVDFLRGVSAREKNLLARYPEKLTCMKQ